MYLQVRCQSEFSKTQPFLSNMFLRCLVLCVPSAITTYKGKKWFQSELTRNLIRLFNRYFFSLLHFFLSHAGSQSLILSSISNSTHFGAFLGGEALLCASISEGTSLLFFKHFHENLILHRATEKIFAVDNQWLLVNLLCRWYGT